ncbi:MAG: ABC transporter substrate-binding protein [Legionellaceae bacterium]|nr:ABC transporter substrate-binding protein [Legionellaceae bacterium]
MKYLQATIFGVSLFFLNALWSASSPVPMLEQAANEILSTLAQNKAVLKSKPEIIYQAVERHLLPKVDVVGMSRSVLGRQAWMKASQSERKAFTKAFTQLVIRTYAAPLAEYSNESVKFLPVRGNADNRFMRVNSIIVRPSGKDIPLAYSMVSKNGQWKIYDLSVEGVSLLQSFRSQFAQALQNSNIQTLIQQMQSKAKG